MATKKQKQGRPKLMKDTVILYVRVDAKMLRQLDMAVIRTNVSKSVMHTRASLVRELLSQALGL